MDTLRGLRAAVSTRRYGWYTVVVAATLLVTLTGGCGTYRICVEPVVVRVELSIHDWGRQPPISEGAGAPAAQPARSPAVPPAAERRHTHD